jgi:hypothetical protein
MSSSDKDDQVDGRVLYEVMSAGRQLLNSDGIPTQSNAVMSPDWATISCSSRPSTFCFFMRRYPFKFLSGVPHAWTERNKHPRIYARPIPHLLYDCGRLFVVGRMVQDIVSSFIGRREQCQAPRILGQSTPMYSKHSASAPGFGKEETSDRWTIVSNTK